MANACPTKKSKREWPSMDIDIDALPDDPKVLKETLQQVIDRANAISRQGQLTEERLLLELARRFGRRSERFEDPSQLLLFGENDGSAPEGQSAGEADEEPVRLASSRPKRNKGRNGRRPLPEHLPRTEIVLDLDEDDRRCTCCDTPMAEIGREVTEQLDYVPASLLVRRFVRPKYACKSCQDGVLTAEPPVGPFPRGLAGPGLLAQVVTAKFCDHLPLHRQEAIFARHGLEIPRSTLCDWIARAAELLTPLYGWMAAQVRTGRKVHVDETPVPVQQPADKRKKRRQRGKKPRADKGYLWAYVGDREHPYTVYDYTPSRNRAGPLRFFEEYSGYVQADDFPGYDALYRTGRMTEVACWAHARRKFHDAHASDRERSYAALAMIRELYELERELHDASDDERRAQRQSRAKPILDRIEVWLHQEHLRVLPKSLIGKAIAYTLKLWPSLTRYLEDGCLDIDNNAAERAIKPLVIGRKNWLFAGSNDGARRGAILASVVATCKRHDVDPFAYLRDLFDRLPTFRGETAELCPGAWKVTAEADATPS
jgi:transposase